MMANDNCPFTLGSRPAVFAGRGAELGALVGALRALQAREPAQPALIVGQIGNGRTTLLREFARQAVEAGWSPAVVSLAPTDDIGQQVARALATAVLHVCQRREDTTTTRSLLRAAHAFGLAYGVRLPLLADAAGVEGTYSGDLATDLGPMLAEVGILCRQAGTGLALLFDDAPRLLLRDLAVLLNTANDSAASNQPVLVVVTGLVSLPGGLVAAGMDPDAARVLSLGLLTPDEVAAAVAEPARRTGRPFTIEGLESFVRRCRGLPTFAQSLARNAWLASDGPITDRDVAVGAGVVERQLVTAVYEPAHRALPPTHRRFLHALMQEGGTATFDAIRRRLGDTNRFDPAASGLAAIRDDLFNREVLAAEGDHLSFTLAGFDRYISKLP